MNAHPTKGPTPLTLGTPAPSLALPAPSDAVRRPHWLGTAASHALVLVSGWGACALSLPEARRPALVLAALGALAVVAALVTGWRIVGSAAVLLVGSTPLMAGALEDDAASTGRLVAATLLVLLLIIGLDGVERRDREGPAPVVLQVTTRTRRWGAPLAAVASCALLGAASAVTVTPSVAFVLLGLVAGVGAVLAATRMH
jgi:hypothetical protein